MIDKRHEHFMRIALGLARRGLGRTAPNPAVGALVVRAGRVVGRGYHRRAGLAHAEVEAVEDAGRDAEGASMYVTLEPCAHTGRTPPCVDTIRRAGIKELFVGMKDPNPKVNGRGIKILRASGIKVTTGILEEECRRLNESYVKYITTGVPFVTLKLATTLDGRIATSSGESRWITSEPSRRYVHRMRAMTDCVMVGSGTVIKDNPQLTVRLARGRNPLRAVVDEGLLSPLDSRVFDTTEGARTILFTSTDADPEKVDALREKGMDVVVLPREGDGVSLKKVLRELGRREITSLMIEGGSRLSTSSLREGVVDKVALFVAPLILGGDATPSVGELGIRRLVDGIRLKGISTRRVGEDILVTGYIKG